MNQTEGNRRRENVFSKFSLYHQVSPFFFKHCLHDTDTHLHHRQEDMERLNPKPVEGTGLREIKCFYMDVYW